MSTPQRIPNYYVREDVPTFDFLQKWVPGQWTAVGDQGSAYLNSWRHYQGGDGINSPALWRRQGDEVEFAGLIDHAGGNFIALQTVLQLPVEMRIPTSLWIFTDTVIIGGGGVDGAARMSYTVATGVLQFVGGVAGSGVANPVTYISLTGLRFPLYST